MWGGEVSAARAKGTTWENAVTVFLRANGWPWAERRALAGNRDRGDVSGIPGVVIEAKAAKTIRLADWLKELDVEMVNDHATTGALFVKRIGKTGGADGFIVMHPTVWADLMKRAGH